MIVGNGCPLPEFADRLGLPGEVTAIEVDENLGCPGGRNVALRRLREFGDVDVVIDLDDDGLLVDPDVLRRVRDLYAADPRLGIVGFRIADELGETQRRHVPRLGAKDPMRGGEVTGFLGGGHALSMEMLAQTGDWPAEFFFAHEETDLAWRAADAGWTIRYEPELLLQHPKTSPARHAIYYRVTARNRVWLVRRRLPLPLIPVHLAVWIALTLAADTVRWRVAGMVRRLRGGAPGVGGGTAADALEDRLAPYAPGAAAGRLSGPTCARAGFARGNPRVAVPVGGALEAWRGGPFVVRGRSSPCSRGSRTRSLRRHSPEPRRPTTPTAYRNDRVRTVIKSGHANRSLTWGERCGGAQSFAWEAAGAADSGR